MWKSYKILVCCEPQIQQLITFRLQQAGQAVQTGKCNSLDIMTQVNRINPEILIISHQKNNPELKNLCESLSMTNNAPPIFVVIPEYSFEIECEYKRFGVNGAITLSTPAAEMLNYFNDCFPSKPVLTTPHSFDIEVQNRICDTLFNLCITANYNGYSFLRDSIKLVIRQQGGTRRISKTIYPLVAQIHHVSPACVERSIRTVIIKSWNKVKIPERVKHFGLHAHQIDWRPTNSEFIFIIADRINRELRTDYQLADASSI